MSAPLFPAPGAPVVVQKKSGPGCWGVGCLIVTLILVLGLLMVGGMSWYVFSMVKSYTADSAIQVPTTDGGADMFNAAEQKIATFNGLIQQHRPASITLSADEINTVIARDPAYGALRGHFFVSINGDQARLQCSFAIGDFEKVLFADRFANADGSFRLGFDPASHEVQINFSNIQFGSKGFTGASLDAFNTSLNTNLNAKLKENAAVSDFLNQTEKLDVENGQLVIETQ